MTHKQPIQRTISRYLESLFAHYAPQTILAYSQALRLFAQLLQKQLAIHPTKASIDTLKVDWAYLYLHHLQENHSIETEHLYSRAILGFYQYVETHIHPGFAGQADILARYLAQHRRAKQHYAPTLPVAAIETILTHVTTASTPRDPDHSISRDTLRLLRDKAFLLTLANTGLRVSEICLLRVEHIDPTHHILLLDTDLQLPLPSPVLAAVNAYLVARKPLDSLQHLFHASHLPLFARHDKKAAKQILPISRWTAANIVAYWTTAALPPDEYQQLISNNCPISPQTFRHYFVIATLQRTGNLHETQTLARHADTATTRRYLTYTVQNTPPESND